MGWYEQSYFPNILSQTNLKFHSNGLTLLLIFNQQCTFRESSVCMKQATDGFLLEGCSIIGRTRRYISYFPNILSKKQSKCSANVLTLLLIFNQQCTFRESSVRRKRQSLTALRDYISGKKKYHVISEKKNCAIGAICDCRLLWHWFLSFCSR